MQAARKLSYYEPWQEKAVVSEIASSTRHDRKTKPGTAAFMAQVVFCMALVFLAMILLLVRYSDIAEQKVNVYQIKAEIKKMELTRDELRASLDKGLDLEAIEKTAVEKLGMQYPAQTQIVYIDKTSLYTLKEPKNPARGNTGDAMQRLAGAFPWFDKKQAMALSAE